MRKTLLPFTGLIFAAMMFAAPAFATNCPSNPFTLTNGQSADATQVMANFNSIVTCLNNSILPNVNPSWTGAATGGSLNLSGTLSVTGTATVGNVAVTGAAVFGNGISSSSFAASVAGGLQTYSLASGVNIHYDGNLVFANGAGTAWLDTSGTWHVPGALIVGGSVTLTAGSVGNAALDTVNGSGGSCGSATTTCALTTNGQGRITSQSSVAISQLPAQSGSASANLGKVLSSNGSAASWTTTGASAWAYVTTSTAGGSCTVVASYNIAGCSRTTQGNFVLTFTTFMNDANYAPFAIAQCMGINASCSIYNPIATPLYSAGPATDRFYIHVQCSNCATNTGPVDPDGMYVVVFGN